VFAHEFQNKVTAAGLGLYNGGPSRTRDVNGTIQKSTLDWIMSREDITAIESRELEGISDHHLLSWRQGSCSAMVECVDQFVLRRNLARGDTAALRRALTEVRWENLALLDLESATKEFTLRICYLVFPVLIPNRSNQRHLIIITVPGLTCC
jgi:hypothetical protein